MNDLVPAGPWDVAVTWVAAAATIVVLGGLFGERRAFGWSQHLFAGLATGYLALLAITEVVVPRLVEPLLAAPTASPLPWAGLVLVAGAAAAPWLPRPIGGIPIAITIGSLAAFAFGGAIIGTLLPQIVTATAVREPTGAETVVAVLASIATVLVVLSFLHGSPRRRMSREAHRLGRWLLVAGLGGWLGYLILSRLVLLTDRVGFLLGDWLGIGR